MLLSDTHNSDNASLFSSSPGEKKDALLCAFYLAPVGYYSALFHAKNIRIEACENYQKQSFRNRCVILGANGLMPLSIPVEKSETPNFPTKDMRIADHGNWRHIHWNAIVSAYNSTPFFDYYRDDFAPFFEKKQTFLFDFNEELRQMICRLIGLDTPVEYTASYDENPPADTMDFRNIFHSKKKPEYETPAYYQVFSERFGFVPNLSIVDLLFNMGNESRLVLRKIKLF